MEYISEIVSFLVGAVGGYTLKVVINKRKTAVTGGRDARYTRVDQRGNRVGGDMAGGDITKRQ